MELSGNFKTLAEIADALQFIQYKQKTGIFSISGYGETINLLIKRGLLINIETECKYLKKYVESFKRKELTLKNFTFAVFDFLMFLKEGNFYFEETDLDFQSEENPLNLESAILDFDTRYDENKKVLGEEKLKKIYSNCYFYINPDIEQFEIRLNNIDFEVLVQLTKHKKTPKDIIFSTTRAWALKKSIFKLVHYNLIIPSLVLSSEQESKIPDNKLQILESLLTDMTGPIGPLLIKNTLKELGFTDGLPKDKINIFLEKLVNKIPEDSVYQGQSSRSYILNKGEKILK